MNDIPLLFPCLVEAEKSPLQNAPASLKELFGSLKFDADTVPLIHPFEKVDMPSFVCSNKIGRNQKYFHCKQCCYDTTQEQYILCEKCYIPEKHEGHEVSEIKESHGDGSCDCGRNLRINETSFCGDHCRQNIEVEIPVEKQKQFNQYFEPLIKIYFFVKKVNGDDCSDVRKLEIALNKNLTELCSNSLFYIRMALSLLETQYSTEQMDEKSSYLLELLDSEEFVPLFDVLATDVYFLKDFAVKFVQEEEKSVKNLFPFKNFRDQLMDNRDVLMELSNKKIFLEDKLSNYLKIVKEGSDCYEMLMAFYEKIQEKQAPKEFLMLLTKDFKKHLNTSSFESTDIKPFLLKMFIKTLNNKVQLSEADKQWFPETFTFVCNLLISICDEKIENLVFLKQYLKKKNINSISEQQIQKFIEKLFEFDEIWSNFTEKMRIPTITTLILSNDHPNKNELVKKVWSRVLADKDNFITNIESMYNFISFLINSYKTIPILGLDESIYKDKSVIEMKEEILRSFLFETKQIGRDKIWKDFNEGWLNFKTTPQIVKEVCRYNDDTETFYFNSPKATFSNHIMKIQDNLSRHWENIRSLEISMAEQFQVKSSILKSIFVTLFNPDGFMEVFKERFFTGLGIVEKSADQSDKWKKKHLGTTYITLLVLIDKLCAGQESQLIKRELETVINDSEERFKFQLYGEKKRIFEVLSISDRMLNEEEVMEQDKEQREEREKQQLKKKKQQKKNQLMKRFQQKRAMTLQKYASKQSEQPLQIEEEEECLLCHQRQKKDKELVMMASLKKNETVARILHGDEIKTSLMIETCFHAIHIHCFSSMKKKDMSFSCPLCKMNVNCFLPIDPETCKAKIWRICWNVINAVLVTVYESYEVPSFFSLLFEAYVEDKGISRIITEGLPSISKRKVKSVAYFDAIIANAYEKISKGDKQEIEEEYHQKMQKIDKCTKQHFKNFQKFIMKSCWESVTSGFVNIDAEFLKDLFSKMTVKEGKILVTILDEICGETKQHNFEEILSKANEENKEMKEQEKHVFGINLLRPSKTIDELIKIKEKVVCEGCSGKEVTCQCIICQKFLCKECEDDQLHKESHCKKIILLYFNEGTIKISKGPRDNETMPIYFNDFMISYKKGKTSDKHDMTYWLSDESFDKAIANFLNLK